MLEDKVFKWQKSTINYTEFGGGNETLICFHGYGQNCHVFRALEPSLGKKYRIVSVDLPHQGKTVWGEKDKLSTAILGDLMKSFLAHIGAHGNISLMAYSIGGNYALGFTAQFPEIINEVWLLAADGLKRKPGFDFVTKTQLGRALFRTFILYPNWVFYTLKMVRNLGLVNHRATKFFYSTIDTKLKRIALYKRWNSTANISIQPKLAKSAILAHTIPVYLIYGKYDSVIPFKNAYQFAEDLPSCSVEIVEKGHQLLVDETNYVITKMMKQ